MRTVTPRVDEDEIDARCDALRKELLAKMNSGGGGNKAGPVRKGLKMHQVHELADAKIKESERLRSALKISKDYQEGGHWKRQEERQRKAAEKEAEEAAAASAAAAAAEERDEREYDREYEREASI